MNADTVLHQRIARLTPLADVLAAIARIEPVAPRDVATAEAHGCVLAVDVIAKDARPAAPVALRDGWAVNSDATRDAGLYAPLTLQPSPERIDAFAVLPPGTDAIAPLDAVGRTMQVMAPVAPGEGILPAGGDVEKDARIAAACSRLRASDIASLSAAVVTTVSIRQPLIRLVNAAPGDAILDAAVAMVARAVASSGAQTEMCSDLDQALRAESADATIAIGGTGAGRHDGSVVALSRAGVVFCHGIGLSPGETSAYGTANGRPVLLMPGRIDAVLACWLVLGRALVDRLSGVRDSGSPVTATLARKVTSTIGLAEVMPLARIGDGVTPLASGYLPLQSLARADGWMLVPAESEGYPAGTSIEMRPMP